MKGDISTKNFKYPFLSVYCNIQQSKYSIILFKAWLKYYLGNIYLGKVKQNYTH